MQSIAYPIGIVDEGCCLWCGEGMPLAKGKRTRKWCSKRCSNKAAEYRRSSEPASDSAPPTKCKGCGAGLGDMKRAGNPKKWCSASCRVKWYRNPENGGDYYENQKSRLADETRRRNEALPDNICPNCGECSRRSASGKPMTYCSDECAYQFRYERHKIEAPKCSVDGCDKWGQAHGLCSSHYGAQWRRDNRDKHSAKNMRYRAQKRHDGAETFSRLEVMELSDWECHICGGPIDPKCPYPDTMYGTVDHVTPLSKGGAHVLENVKAAHHICNSMKRDNEDFKLVR